MPLLWLQGHNEKKTKDYNKSTCKVIFLNKAEIEIICDDPQIIVDSLKPEMEKLEKFNAEIKVDDSKIKLSIEAEEISGLLAGINSYIRLIRTSIETNKIGE